MVSEIQKEVDFFRANQDDLVEKYDGKVIAIKDGEVLGVFDSDIEAVTEVQKDYPLGTFLIRRVSAGDEAYTIKINTAWG